MRTDREKKFHNERYTDNRRERISSVYRLAEDVKKIYRNLVMQYCSLGFGLEYGCGTGELSLELTTNGARVVGIDISPVAVEAARFKAKELNISADFTVEDAERMSFSDESFDVVFGSGILHHLNLSKSLREVKRVLRSGGHAVFFEPMGHNPLIKLFRWVTPSLRSVDEHPLTSSDLEYIKYLFPECHFRFFHFLTLFALPFRGLPVFHSVVGLLSKADERLFSVFPGLHRQSWIVLIELIKN